MAVISLSVAKHGHCKQVKASFESFAVCCNMYLSVFSWLCSRQSLLQLLSLKGRMRITPAGASLQKRTSLAGSNSAWPVVQWYCTVAGLSDTLEESSGNLLTISCAARYMDNPRFGLDGWMQTHHGNEQNYKLNLKMNANNEVCCAACNTKIVHKL